MIDRDIREVYNVCADVLMEAEWNEGYVCTRAIDHKPPHREESGIHADLKGISTEGKSYKWAYEWAYDE